LAATPVPATGGYLLVSAALSSTSSVGLHGRRDGVFRMEAELPT